MRVLAFLIFVFNFQLSAYPQFFHENEQNDSGLVKQTIILKDTIEYKKTINPKSQKILPAVCLSQIYNASMFVSLFLLPEEISKWNNSTKYQFNNILSQYKRTFNSPPVLDHDLFIINYVGHPFQGSLYYNSLRSNGANVVQSAIFSFSQTLIWEYIWEGGMEQPSIQDIIVTPVIGSLLGELIHTTTLAMKKNGFKWYEKVFVTIFNTSYVLNNGYK